MGETWTEQNVYDVLVRDKGRFDGKCQGAQKRERGSGIGYTFICEIVRFQLFMKLGKRT